MILDDIKNIEDGISSLSKKTNMLGNKLDSMPNQDIMREGMGIRDNLKEIDLKITSIKKASKKDNPTVYDIDVGNFTNNKIRDSKNRLNELMEATADFNNVMGMQTGGILPSNQMFGEPRILDPEPPTKEQQTKDLIRQMPSPLLRLIQGQRASFFPQLGFGFDPYRLTIMDALNQKIPTFPEGVESTDMVRPIEGRGTSPDMTMPLSEDIRDQEQFANITTGEGGIFDAIQGSKIDFLNDIAGIINLENVIPPLGGGIGG